MPGRRRLPLVAGVLLALAAPAPAAAQLAQVEAGPLRLVHFGGADAYLIPHVVRSFLNALEWQRRVLGFEPEEQITVLLADFEDHGNAGASAVPRNSLMVQMAPLSFAFETIAANERMNTIMNHELVHVSTMDQATARDRRFRRLFGGKVAPIAEQPESILYFYLTAPRVAAPRWYHEGIAVFLDTWMAGGIGRAQSGFDEMVFRAMVRDGARFYDPLGLVAEGTKIDFQLQINSYLYGARFITWLAHHFSPEHVVRWVRRDEGSRGYYADQFHEVFGLPLEEAWKAWTVFEGSFQSKNLAAIRTYPTTKYRDISARALGSVSRAYFEPDRGRLYAAFNYPGAVAHVGAIDVETGATERLVDIKGPVIYTVASLAYDPFDKVLFYTTDNGSHRDLVQLDPATRRTELLIKDARIGDLAFNRADRSLWGIRHFNGIVSLVRLPPPYTAWTRVFTWPYGTVVYDLDVSPDGAMASASFGEISGKQDVRVLSIERLLAGDDTPLRRFDFGPSVPSGFVFSGDGRFLYGSSYYTGVSNIFRYEIAAGDLQAVSNTETGFFRPVPIGGDALLLFRYSGEGFVATRIEAQPLQDVSAITFLGQQLTESHPVVTKWMAGSPADVPLDEIGQRAGSYGLGGGMRRESFYPVLQGYKDSVALGVRMNLSDPLQLNRASLVAAWSPDAGLPASERVHLRAEYQRYDWHVRAALNGADFYDLFGPTKTSRKGYAFGVGWKRALLYDDPRRVDLELEARMAGNLDRLPDYQNIEVDVDRLATAEARLAGSDVRSSLGSVDDEKGTRWSVNVQADAVAGALYPRLHGTWDRGAALPLGHSSIWLRGAAGFSPRDRDDPFANFFFGGFGNNWVDRGAEKRYREYYSLPGAELNELGGRNFVRGLVEWNLPPVRFSTLGTPGFHLTWARTALFAGTLATNLDAAGARRVAATAGAQVDFRFTVLSNLDMTLSIGGGLVAEDGFAPRREAMVSLKVLR
jgi:hypothetical protein